MQRVLLLVDRKDFGAVALVARRYRLAVGSVLGSEGERLLREGLQWDRGANFREKNALRGQALVRAAAAGGLPLAVANCRWFGWGGYNGGGDDKRAEPPSGVSGRSRQTVTGEERTRRGPWRRQSSWLVLATSLAREWRRTSQRLGCEVVPEGGRARI
eukprot:SAG22_NODE_304_length_12712_cov_10.515421_1_plen_158_part_00